MQSRLSLSLSFLIALLFLSLTQIATAGSATWNLTPANVRWNSSSNWTPVTVPDGPNDIATFALSNTTAVSLASASIEINSIVFAAGASAFTIDLGTISGLTISGAGITNDSGVTQNFNIPRDLGSGWITFSGSATAGGSDVIYTNNGYGSNGGADILFLDNSSAGEATFINSFAMYFNDRSTAANATFINNAGDARDASPGYVYFSYVGGGSAEGATFINNGATVRGARGGQTMYYASQSLGHSTVIANGGTADGAGGGYVDIGNGNVGSAGGATLIANGGTNGGDGGYISITFGTAHCRVEVFGNGIFDVGHGVNTAKIGSLEGDGKVFLGNNQLLVGLTDQATVFSGTMIEDQNDSGGSFGVIGGSITLTGANHYTAGTVILDGNLIVNSRGGSGTGSGPVDVEAGRLGGRGVIAGTVTVGTGTGAGAALAPGRSLHRIDTLMILSALTFNADATYSFELDSSSTIADSVVANGVTINNGAQFSANETGNVSLPSGTEFTVINNTGSAAILGTFANLPDGGTITIGSNTFQANYEGGDGNDLTLTVMP